MTLTLTIQGTDTLENGQPARFDLDRHGAMIGRSPHADWSLPDPRNLVSSRHCEISYQGGQYLLTDHSTNGTYLNGAADPLRSAHVLVDGDRFSVGHYAITAHRGGTALKPVTDPGPVSVETDDWDAFPEAPPAGGARDDGPKDDGWADPVGPVADTAAGWRSRAPRRQADVTASAWDLPAPVARPSAWSSAPSAATGPTADDVWGRLSEGNEIDWSRGTFGAVTPPAGDWAPVIPVAPANHDEAKQASPAPARPAVFAGADDGWAQFVAASGFPADRLGRSPAQALAAAGSLLRQLVGGLMLMIDARARAKAQLGVQATGLELDGNNPLKFVRSPERALLQLLDATGPGFMPAERAVEDAYQDLQAHQMATLSAMRGALKGTLARFSPDAFRDRFSEPRGLARWFPALHHARHWDAFVHDFEGVVRGADDAFMDVYAKEFRLHYDRHIGDMKQRRRDQPD